MVSQAFFAVAKAIGSKKLDKKTCDKIENKSPYLEEACKNISKFKKGGFPKRKTNRPVKKVGTKMAMKGKVKEVVEVPCASGFVRVMVNGIRTCQPKEAVKKRGRPKKMVEAVVMEETIPVVSAPKRARGRPKKEMSNVAQLSQEKKQIKKEKIKKMKEKVKKLETEKKKRGRKPKSEMTPSALMKDEQIKDLKQEIKKEEAKMKTGKRGRPKRGPNIVPPSNLGQVMALNVE